MNKKHCAGCRDNYYNLTGEGCWSLSSAKLIKRKLVPMDQRPPWDQPAQMLPSCYRKAGYAVFNGDRTE